MPSDIIKDLRTELDDSDNSKQATDDVSKQMTSTNKRFVLNHRPIVSGSEVVTKDGVILTVATEYTINYSTGVVTLIVAVPTYTLVVSYFWQDFLDDELDGFIYDGLGHVSLGTTRANAETDFAAAPQGLQQVIEHYALYHAFAALASKTIRLHKAGAGKKNVDKADTGKKYLDASKFWHEAADKEREDYYKRQGRRNAPASAEQAVQYPTNTPIR
jgi:hypothetical protein